MVDGSEAPAGPEGAGWAPKRFDVDSLLCKEISRTRGINPVLLIDIVGRFRSEDREAAREYLVKGKNMSESLADKAMQGALVYWNRAAREKRRRRDLL